MSFILFCSAKDELLGAVLDNAPDIQYVAMIYHMLPSFKSF